MVRVVLHHSINQFLLTKLDLKCSYELFNNNQVNTLTEAPKIMKLTPETECIEAKSLYKLSKFPKNNTLGLNILYKYPGT